MPRILVIFATTDGHTAKVARFVADTLLEQGHEAVLHDARDRDHLPRAQDFDAVIAAASVHVSGYQQALRQWARHNAADLATRPNAFLSVCMGIVQGTPRVMADLEAIVERFVAHTGWKPQRVEFVAGAIPYSRYGLLKRWVMQYMSRQAGTPTDPRKDHEFTDWDAVQGFAVKFGRGVNGEE